MSQRELAKIRIEVLIRLAEKVEKDLKEAYERIPAYFSAKPYIHRALRNVENMRKIIRELDSFISSHKG